MQPLWVTKAQFGLFSRVTRAVLVALITKARMILNQAHLPSTSGQRNYVGIDGSSFIANINAASGSTPPSCDFSGVMTTGYSASDSSVMISSKGSKNPANHQQSKASKSVVTSTTSTLATTTTTTTTTSTITCKNEMANCDSESDTSCCSPYSCKFNGGGHSCLT